MKYKISNAAKLDLEDIWLFTLKNWSVDQADRYLNLILDEVEYLSIKPNSGFDFSNVRKGYFRSKVKFHFIFYKVNENQNEIEIIRVLHEMMDIENQLLK